MVVIIFSLVNMSMNDVKDLLAIIELAAQSL